MRVRVEAYCDVDTNKEVEHLNDYLKEVIGASIVCKNYEYIENKVVITASYIYRDGDDGN